MKQETRAASAALEAFLDKCHQVAKEHGFKGPSLFERMRREYGSHHAAEMLVESGNLQSGLEWCRENGLLHYSVEAAVLKFKDEFDPRTVQCAKWRLKLMKEGPSG